MDLNKLQGPLEAQLARLGFELVLLEAAREGRDEILRLYLDHADGQRGVTLDDCVAASEGLLAWMDVEFPDLREKVGVEVSSPGLERPLTKRAHFERFQGRLCRLQTKLPVNGQKRFKGWIVTTSEGAVTIEEDGVLKAVPFEAMQKARLAPFDEDKTPKPKHIEFRPQATPTEDAGVETSAGAED
jgi:ribosome maturation factor RimP